jgi:hypothetical protein
VLDGGKLSPVGELRRVRLGLHVSGCNGWGICALCRAERERGQHNKCSPLELEVLVVERRLIELLPVRYL